MLSGQPSKNLKKAKRKNHPEISKSTGGFYLI